MQGARAGRPNWRALVCGTNHNLDRIHDDAVVRRADLIQLEQIASGYPSRERFLTELARIHRTRPAIRPVCPCSEDYLIPKLAMLKAIAAQSSWPFPFDQRSVPELGWYSVLRYTSDVRNGSVIS